MKRSVPHNMFVTFGLSPLTEEIKMVCRFSVFAGSFGTFYSPQFVEMVFSIRDQAPNVDGPIGMVLKAESLGFLVSGKFLR